MSQTGRVSLYVVRVGIYSVRVGIYFPSLFMFSAQSKGDKHCPAAESASKTESL